MPKRVLNVGGNTKEIPLPAHYNGWEQVLLDIDSGPTVDLVADARELQSLEPEQFDAIYASHVLEHFFLHDLERVIKGFAYMLNPEGFVEAYVPDVVGVMRTVIHQRKDLYDFLYQSPAGPITARDVLYGSFEELKRSGNDYFAHKNGFSEKSLKMAFGENGFPWLLTTSGDFNLGILAFKNEPKEETKKLLGLI